jgi:type I restriction enzyme S subunit
MIRVDQAGAVRLGRQRSPDKHTGRHATKYVRAANITPAGLDLSDLLEMDFTPRERQIFALADGDILLTEASGSAAHVGRAALWRGEIDDCCYQNTLFGFGRTSRYLNMRSWCFVTMLHRGPSPAWRGA